MEKEFGVRECFLGSWNLNWIRRIVKKKARIDGMYYAANELEVPSETKESSWWE